MPQHFIELESTKQATKHSSPRVSKKPKKDTDINHHRNPEKNGKIEKISSDYLIGLLAKTGGDFRYSFRQPTKKQAAERLLA